MLVFYKMHCANNLAGVEIIRIKLSQIYNMRNKFYAVEKNARLFPASIVNSKVYTLNLKLVQL